MKDKSIFTKAVHAGKTCPPPDFVPVSTPVYNASTYYYRNMDDLDAVFAGTKKGYVYTRYGNPTNKALEEAVAALEKYDLVFVHIEAPDEAGHSGNPYQKKKALEQIDKHIVGPVHKALQQYDAYRILVMPDHPTPVQSRSHSETPVPFAMAGKDVAGVIHKPLSEQNAQESGFYVEKGYELMEYFLKI